MAALGASYRKIAAAVGRTIGATAAKANLIGICVSREERGRRIAAALKARHGWPPEQEAELRRRFALNEPYTIIAAALGRSVAATNSKGRQLGLRVSPEEISIRMSRTHRARIKQ